MSSTPSTPRGSTSGPVLILGGTAEARELAAALVDAGRPVISSLAGRVRHPALPEGQVRVGGFSGMGVDGVTGLATYLAEQQIAALVDATHPFAVVISANAAAACARTGTPVIRLERPGWLGHPDAGSWTWVGSVEDAVEAGAWAQRQFLTSGRQSLGVFLGREESPARAEPSAGPALDAADTKVIVRRSWVDKDVTVRLVDAPEFALPPRWRVIQSRGPYAYADELALMRAAGTDLLVTKDSGGRHTAAKLDAARDLGIPVLVIARPPVATGVATVSDVAAVVAWLG